MVEDAVYLRVRDTDAREGRDETTQSKRMKQLNNDELLALLAERDAWEAERDAQLAEKDAQVAELAERVARVVSSRREMLT